MLKMHCNHKIVNEFSDCLFNLPSFCVGVEVTKEVTLTAVIMAATTVPYFIIQSSDWYFGATRVGEREPSYVRWAALVTMIISFTGFVAYIVMQFFMASKGANTAPMIKHQKHKEEEIVLRVWFTLRSV